MTTSDFIFLALPAVLLAGTFYSAGELIRYRMRAPKVPRFLDDLRGLEDAFVDFFASSETSAGVLRVLAAHEKPLGFKALAERLRAHKGDPPRHEDIPLGALRAVLKILIFARLIRMGMRGFSITGLGREVYRRMPRRGREDTLRARAIPTADDPVKPAALEGAERSTTHFNHPGLRRAAIS